MKKAFSKIGMVLLFIVIGFCFVQLEFSKPMLIDNDVGVECTIDVADNAILLETIAMPDKIASPLKYSIVIVGQDNTGSKFQEVWFGVNNDYNRDNTYIVDQISLISEITSPDSINEKPKESKINLIVASKYTFVVTGLYRLDAGENYSKTVIC